MSDNELDVPATESKFKVENAASDDIVLARSTGVISRDESFDTWNRLCLQYGLDQFQLLPQPESNDHTASSVAAGQNLFPHIQSDSIIEMENISFGDLTVDSSSEAEDYIRDVYVEDIDATHASNSLPLGQPLHFSHPGLDQQTMSAVWQPSATPTSMMLLTPILPPGPLSGQVGVVNQIEFTPLPSPGVLQEPGPPRDEVAIDQVAETVQMEQLISLEELQEVYESIDTQAANAIQDEYAAANDGNNTLLESVIDQARELHLNNKIFCAEEDSLSENNTCDEETAVPTKHTVRTDESTVRLDSRQSANSMKSDLDIAVKASTIAAIKSVSGTFDSADRDNHLVKPDHPGNNTLLDQLNFNRALDAAPLGLAGTCEQVTPAKLTPKYPLSVHTFREEPLETLQTKDADLFESRLPNLGITKRGCSNGRNAKHSMAVLDLAPEAPIKDSSDQDLLFTDIEDNEVLEIQTNNSAPPTDSFSTQNGTTRGVELIDPVCQLCRHHKIRCDKTKPSCSNCLKAEPSLNCLYRSWEKARNDTSRRIRKMKSRNMALSTVQATQDGPFGVQEGGTLEARLKNPEQSLVPELSEGHSFMSSPPRPQMMERCDSAPGMATHSTSDGATCSGFLRYRERLRGLDAPLTDPLGLVKLDRTSYFPLETKKTPAEGFNVGYLQTSSWSEAVPVMGSVKASQAVVPSTSSTLPYEDEIVGYKQDEELAEDSRRTDPSELNFRQSTTNTADQGKPSQSVAYDRFGDKVVSSSGFASSMHVEERVSQNLPNSNLCIETAGKWTPKCLDEEPRGDMREPPFRISVAFAKIHMASSPYVSPYSSGPPLSSTPVTVDTVATTQEPVSSTPAPGKIGKKRKSTRQRKGTEQASVLLANGRMHCHHSCRGSLATKRTGEPCRHVCCLKGVDLPAMPTGNSFSPQIDRNGE